jgi:ArsR family transcriptional regulator, virulence genes transcriptional regulator
MPQSVFDLQADLCRMMANATRLRIVHQLRAGPAAVGTIAQEMGLEQAKVSQHLAVLRAHGIVVSDRQGAETVYRIANPKIVDVCDLMHDVLTEQAAERSKLMHALRNAKM